MNSLTQVADKHGNRTQMASVGDLGWAGAIAACVTLSGFAVQAQDSASAPDLGTNSAKTLRTVELKNEYIDLGNGISNNTLRLTFSQALDQNGKLGLKVTLP
jgi:hypothetical protein